jgi:serine/threonine protein kinase
MTDEMRVRQLLQRSLDLDLTPEEVCAVNPDLLPAVRDRWERCQQIESELDSIFSSEFQDGDGKQSDNDADNWNELPQIPGYAVELFLGRGGVGIVFKARDLRLDRVVALKMLLSGTRASPLERARFLRETRSVAALHDENIVQIHDVGESDGLCFFTMEYLEGGTLADHLARSDQPANAANICRATELIATLADAIACAHDAGIIHRDLKPANILLTSRGVPKISDFGIARSVDGADALTLTGIRMGTPSYMAPEQVTGPSSAVGPAADIYALGVILYETMTGQPPFRGASAAEIVRQLMVREPIAPSQLNTQIPFNFEKICLKCLRKDPQQRYSSAASLADTLRRCAYDELRSVESSHEQ